MAVAIVPSGNKVDLRLQPTRPIVGKSGIDHDRVSAMLGSGRADEVLPVLQHLSAAGKDTIEALQVTEAVGRLLKNRNPDVAAAAAGVMAQIGAERMGQRHCDALLELMQRPSDSCVMAALSAIGKVGQNLQPAQKVEVIKQVTDCFAGRSSGSVPVRVAAIRALAELKATRQALLLCDVMEQDKVPEVKGAALEALAKLSVLTYEAESCFPPEMRGKVLGEMLANPRTQYSALMAMYHLGEKAPEPLLPVVVGLLTDQDISIRGAAAVAVGGMSEIVAKSKDAMAKLQSAIKSTDPAGRAAAISALGAMGPAAASQADLIAELVTDVETVSTQQQITSAGKRAPAHLRLPRAAALMALGRMRVGKHADAVAQGLLDKDWQVRMAAAEALGMLGEAAQGHVSSLMGLVCDDAYQVRAVVCKALGELKSCEAMPGLAQAFEDPAQIVRASALEAAAKVCHGSESYCHEIFKLFNDPIGKVRAAAVRALSRHTEIGPNYAGVVAGMMTDMDPDVRAAAAGGLPFLGAAGQSFAEEVNACLDDPSASVRQAAAEALEQMGFRHTPAPVNPLMARNAGATKAGYSPLQDMKDPVEGLGQYYKSIMMKKSELEKSGRWIGDGVL